LLFILRKSEMLHQTSRISAAQSLPNDNVDDCEAGGSPASYSLELFLIEPRDKAMELIALLYQKMETNVQ
jgi:hypothetical protein